MLELVKVSKAAPVVRWAPAYPASISHSPVASEGVDGRDAEVEHSFGDNEMGQWAERENWWEDPWGADVVGARADGDRHPKTTLLKMGLFGRSTDMSFVMKESGPARSRTFQCSLTLPVPGRNNVPFVAGSCKLLISSVCWLAG